MPTSRLSILAVIVLGPALAARAQVPLADVLEQSRTRHDVPALGAMTLRGDVVREQAAVGVRKRGTDDAVTPADLWHLGSCTKAMTATLVGRLVESGVMRWDMTISAVFPELPRTEGVHPEYMDVTIEQLLTNRGGVPGDLRAQDWQLAWRRDLPLIDQRHRLMIEMLRRPPAVPIGHYGYSNQGYMIAGHMCERVTRQPWESLITEHVFKPLGMTTAGFGAPGTRGTDQPTGHRADGAPADPRHDNPPVLSAAGRVHCRLDDWGRFVAIHMNGTPQRLKFLSAPTYARLHAPGTGPGRSYAMGWSVLERRWGGTVLTHAGSNTMWYCVTWISPEKDLAVLVTCNQAGDAASKACDEVAWALIQRELARREAESDAGDQ